MESIYYIAVPKPASPVNVLATCTEATEPTQTTKRKDEKRNPAAVALLVARRGETMKNYLSDDYPWSTKYQKHYCNTRYYTIIRLMRYCTPDLLLLSLTWYDHSIVVLSSTDGTGSGSLHSF